MNRPSDSPFGSGRPPRTPVVLHLWIALGVGLVFGLVVFVARAPISRVLGVAVVLAATAFVLLRAMEVAPVEWPAAPPGRSGRVGSTQRWRLNGFDAMVDKVPGFSPHLQSRLQALASAILLRHELAAGSPGAIALLGAGTHQLLFPAERKAVELDTAAVELYAKPKDPTGDELAALVDRLIELGGSPNSEHHR